ncbi:MAG TPA: hypothetical protein VK070_13480 [Acidimicrobiia bacterium]|nr:hypothetical protein [Acidimicrobiia bacterium]
MADVAYVLGILSSIPLDWYARRFVELHLTFQLLSAFPMPSPDRSDPLRQRVVEIAGELAAVDARYAAWAEELGVSVGSRHIHEEREDGIAELDAVVSHLYGLDEEDVVHIFETFHDGWDYTDRLEQVLEHFRRLA